MKHSELKNLIIGSLDNESDNNSVVRTLENEGISYDFRDGFTESVLQKIMADTDIKARETDFLRSMRVAFNRIAITGVAAIILLLISIFIAEGSLTLNSFLGIGDTFDEGIISMLTGY